MKRIAASFSVLICVLALAACRHSAPPRVQGTTPSVERAVKPAGKGIELYSWKPAGGE